MTNNQITLYYMNELAFNNGLYDEETYLQMEMEIMNIDKNKDVSYN